MAAHSMYQLVKKSYTFLKKRKYLEAYALIESVMALNPGDSYVLFLYAVAAFHNDKFDRAYRVLDRLAKDAPDYEPYVCLQAFLTMKSVKSMEEASSVYGEFIFRYPEIKELYRGLRSVTSTHNFEEFQRNILISDIVPVPAPPSSLKKLKFEKKEKKINSVKTAPFRKPVRRKRQSVRRIKTILIVIVLFLITSLLGVVAYYFFNETYKNISKKNDYITDDRIDQVTLGGSNYDLIQRINRKPEPEFYYSSVKLSKDFNRAKILIKRNSLNKSLLLLNKIYNSNANQIVKEKVDFLIKFVIDQDQREYEKVDFRVFTKKLYLYRGYSLELTGKVSNLKKSRKGSSFTLLVNYDRDDNFSGAINIFTSEYIGEKTIVNGKRVSVQGVFITTVGKKQHIHIVAHSIKVL